MRSRDEFIARWRNHVAGVVSMGSAEMRKSLNSPLASTADFGSAIMRVADTTESLLGKLYDDLVQPMPVIGNGKAVTK